MVMVERRWLRSRGSGQIPVGLHGVRSPVSINSSHGSAAYTCPRLVRGMIKQGSDVVHEERIQMLRDLFLVGELEGSFERNPGAD